MDQDTRTRLRSVVTRCRRLLEEAVEQVLQGQFDVYATGKNDQVHADEKANLKNLSAEDKAYRADILAHLKHIEALGYTPKDALGQLVREIAFTHLNRLCAYKMMAAREVWIGGQKFRDAVGRSMQSQGFDFYLAKHDADKRLSDEGHRDLAYRHYLNWVGGLLSEEIGVLFSPNDPANRLYPPQRVLDDVLTELNSDDLKGIWGEDETIGWVYQYFTPKELRDQVRKESPAPRNSYELAFRNQFFTPRYVVEFLTDNTLGRMWYEMRQGRTRLADQCRYLVRRPDEVFLSRMTFPEAGSPKEAEVEAARLLREGDEETFPPFDARAESVQRMIEMAHTVSAYERHGDEVFRIWNGEDGPKHADRVSGLSTQYILDWLFMTCRADRHGGMGEVYTEGWFLKLANEVRRRAVAARNPDLKTEELLRLPMFVPHRAKKDPRELRVLDPACGSGHFLLYCFDLLLMIYEEAYDDADLGPTLKEDYPTIEALRRDVPRLILAHNLHGIDIDPRATQIAALALWLRCQRRYRELGLKEERARITRSNVVCAEPMPGERHMLKEFVGKELGVQPEGKLLGQLVEMVFEKMKLAGEAGSLLKIEEEIRNEVAEAKRQFRMGGLSAQPSIPGFGDEAQPVARRYAVRKLQGDAFFEEAEDKVVEALKAYAEKAHNGDRMQRRLFADDAVRGFAFVEMCHQQFDVVLMNPPFGDGSKQAKEIIEKQYPRTKNDLYAAFVERGLSRLHRGGMLGAITSRTGFFLSSFQKWREEILLDESRPITFADLGHGVLDTAMVETAAYCIEARRGSGRTPFIRLLSVEDKSTSLLRAVESQRRGETSIECYSVDPRSFEQVPGSPFAYWVSERVRHLFRECPAFESADRCTRVGLQTSDDFRFIRCWWEVSPGLILDALNGPKWRESVPALQTWCRERTFKGKRWVPIAKGGAFSPYFNEPQMVVNWERDGEEMKAWADPLYGNSGWSRIIKSVDFYFRPGLTWPLRGIRLSAQAVPAGACFSVAGKLATSTNIKDLFPLLGLMNSLAFDYLVGFFAGKVGGVQYEVGLIGKVPVPSSLQNNTLATLSQELSRQAAWSMSFLESRHLFVTPRLVNGQAKELTDQLADYEAAAVTHRKRVSEQQEQLDALSFQLYDIGADDRIAMGERLLAADFTEEKPDQLEEDGAEGAVDNEAVSSAQAVRELVSYGLGCIVGRWDIRLATGESRKTEAYDPFDPLPVCSPGMLQGDDGLPLLAAPHGYPLRIDSDGVIPDDPDHAEDIVRRVREVLELILKDRAAAIEKEACEILGVKELRDYFRKPGKGGFWDDHVSRYSKSRRKAPIYWLLQSSKKSYGLWLYYHRLDKDILFKALQPGGPVQTKINLEQNKLGTMREQRIALGDTGKGVNKLEKEIEKKELLVAELQDFEEKLRRAANLDFGTGLDSDVVYEPDLNDGVVLNIAPLWELVPWKEAKNYWQELLAGEYAWSSMGKLLRKKGLVK